MAGSYFSTDTITAVATSLAGDGGVGVIRLSGSKSVEVAKKLTRGFSKPEPRYLHRIDVIGTANDGKETILDDGLAVYFPAGQSFTGEEVVELQLHGGRFLLQSILQLLLSTGLCRMALPGEFSFRAVRNGKLNLSGAAALGQLIGARSMFEVQAARRNLGEARCKDFDALASSIRNLLAQTELSIDFIDQDVEVISADQMKTDVSTLITRTDELLVQMKAAQRIARGLQVTLTGAPNAGKSTLFNALLAEDRAIVSAEAGTTRDVITEEIVLGPYYVRLADTAGLRTATGSIEAEGVNRAQDLVTESDVVVLVIDGSASVDDVRTAVSERLNSGIKFFVALNKCDVLQNDARTRLVATIASLGVESVCLSAVRAEGIETLLNRIKSELDQRFGLGLNSFLPTEFQFQMLLECRAALAQSLELLETSRLAHPELLSASLHSSVRALSDLVGETTPDTVLTKIFSEFCIGK